MGLLDLISSGGQTGPTLGETAIGLEKLKMQQQELGLRQQSVMSNLQSLREKKETAQLRKDIISSSQREAFQLGGSEAQQAKNFSDLAINRARATGDLDLADQLKESYKSPKVVKQDKWERLAQLSRIDPETRTPAESREFEVLYDNSLSKITIPGATKNEVVHATTILKDSVYEGELEGADRYVQDLATKAKALQRDAGVNGQALSYGDALKQAEAELSQYISDRDLTIKFGQNNYEYSPPPEGVESAPTKPGYTGELSSSSSLDEFKSAGQEETRKYMAAMNVPENKIEEVIKEVFGTSTTKKSEGGGDTPLTQPRGKKGEIQSSADILSKTISSLVPDEVKEKGLNSAISNWLRENQ